MNYQFITDYDFDKYHAHVGSYVVPLPWRHELVFFGAYATFRPDYSVYGDPALSTLQGDGTMYQLSARYAVPLRPLRNLDHELSFGFDFKRTDSPLLFSGSTAGGLLQTNLIDVAQFTMDYRGLLKDRWGRTAFSIQGYYSPGDLTEYNNTPAFTDASPGADAQYVYGRAELRRETLLPGRFSWYLRAMGQYADSQMVPSETFGIGGYATVRGYDERTVSGDYGWLVVNELRSPRLVLGNLTEKADAADWVQLVVFCDYGGVITRDPNPRLFERYGENLLSVGVGARYEMADNIRVRIDYGYQLSREYLTSPNQLIEQPHGRVHIGVEASF
jgi:hemolysin activation/secretion protein